MHKPIQINDLGVSFPSTLCFEQFNYHIHFGQRIAIIGRNGCGKSTLLNILAKIAAAPPKILILDEITNNLDLETRQHVTDILQDYPAALLVISHEHDFLEQIGIAEYLDI